MPDQHQYHHPEPPGPPGDNSDPDSDLDIDLQELDPFQSRSLAQRRSADGRPGSHEARSRIPLRNLRLDGLHGLSGRRRGNTQAFSGQGAAADDDRRGLLDDDDGSKTGSAASLGQNGDEAPLLRRRESDQRPQKRRGTLARLGSALRFRSLVATSPHLPTPDGVAEEEPEGEVEHDPQSNRTVAVGQLQASRFPPNAVSNAKYTPWSFLPITLYNEFSFFFNLYFLLVALSQIIRPLRIGYLSTYVAPLAFVLAITLGKEAFDDIARRRRDAEANAESYTVLRFDTSGRSSGGQGKPASGGSNKLRRSRKRQQQNFEENQHLREGRNREHASDSLDDAPSASYQEAVKASRDLKVGDVLKLSKDQRVPADVILLGSFLSQKAIPEEPASDDVVDTDQSEPAPNGLSNPKPGLEGQQTPDGGSGQDTGGAEAFIRTDQLDGETDWKLRLPSSLTQSLDITEYVRLRVTAGKPDKRVNDFTGTVELVPKDRQGYDPYIDKRSIEDRGDEQSSTESQVKKAALNIDNTAWANTVLASSSTVYAVVVYTGSQTRQALSTSPSRSKTGLLEYEINSLTKILCFLTLALSFILVAAEGFEEKDGRKWYVSVMRFLILFSTIVPISLRVNLDLGKSVYAWYIQHDAGIPGTIVRTSTIPEDLGRVEYLLTDKTGTLTQNEMELKKIHVGTVSYANDAMDEVASYIRQAFGQIASSDGAKTALFTPSSAFTSTTNSGTRTRREIGARVRDVVLALALCHNVTPTVEEDHGERTTTYQASSPDEIAIVRWTESVGLRLLHRDRQSIVLQFVDSERIVVRVKILNIFPFTSDSKRMGIIVRFVPDADSSTASDAGEIWFFQKGADTVMTSIVAANDWLDEETANMAREGLRTLVIGRKKLSSQQYEEFSQQYAQASLSLHARDASMAAVVSEHLERGLELLGVTGVEDKLQRDVKPSLELLRNAGVKIWMLTGDKVETARCVAVSAKLVSRGQYIHTIAKMTRKDAALDSFDLLRTKPDACLLIDGDSLALMLAHHRDAFIRTAVRLPAVIACRCSPTQKADVARLIRAYTRKRTCCIGDGGNDVSMIQAADVGVGIVGKEGRQASLAADFSIEQFCYLTKLLVWHGRNSYKRSAKLAQFVIHRGLIFSVCQTLYSIASQFEPVALYRDWLLVGYATVYTMAPVFSLTLDRDVDPDLAALYPELYKELALNRSLSYRTFFIWVAVSIYQGCIIQGLSQILVGFDDFSRMVAVSYTVLILNELIMVAAEVTTWHPVMIFSIVGTAAIYFGTIPFLGGYFDLKYIISVAFLWRVLAISAVSLIPPYVVKLLRRKIRPPSYRKVQAL
ncbi:MAG: putative aminophospholipid-translocase [Bathelium mastoideum]|nr:MAG: putative aminophospholipid-translocase [Bathelium mastoideum]